MKSTILALTILFPVATPSVASGTYPAPVAPSGYVQADLRPAIVDLARDRIRPGNSLVAAPGVRPGCVAEIRTHWIHGNPVRTSRALCRYSDGSVRPLR